MNEPHNQELYTNNPYNLVPNPSISYPPLPPPLPHPYPVSNSGHYPFNHSDFGAKPSYQSHQNAVSSATWVVKQPAPVQYYSPPQAIQPSRNETNASMSYEALPNCTLIHQESIASVSMRPLAITNDISGSQSVRCQLCNVKCDTIRIYEKHLSGKKHAKNLLKLCDPAQNAAKQELPQSSIGQGIPGATTKLANLEVHQTVGERALMNVVNSNPGSVRTGETNAQHNLSKKRKIALARCGVCNIACTSNDGLQIHFVGKKHQKNLQKLQNLNLYTITPASTAAPLPSTAAPKPSTAIPLPSTTSPAATAATTCTICSVVCNSETAFKSHLAGQKHAARVKQPEREASANAATTCTLCRVVCNSYTSFDLHLRSQKHVKRAGAPKASNGLKIAYPAP